MITLCELSTNPARDIIEGRTKLRTVRTIPYVPPQLKVLSRPVYSEEDFIILKAKTIQPHRPRVNTEKWADMWEQFSQHIGRGEFTAITCSEFLVNLGYESRYPVTGVQQKLSRMRRSGVVEQVRRDGLEFIWRFTQ